MLERMSLAGVGPVPALDLELAPRLNLLTGDNGLGKTFVLDVAWWGLTHSWAGSPAWPDPDLNAKPSIQFEVSGLRLESSYRFEEQRWLRPDLPLKKSSLLIYAQVDGSFSVWDPARNSVSGPRSGWVNDLPEAFHFSPDKLWNGLEENGRILSNGLIRDWVSWQSERAEAFEQLTSVLKALSPGDQEELRPGKPTRVRLDDSRAIPTLAMPYGTVPLTFVSAGMKRVIGLAYLLVWAWQEHLQASRLLRRPLTEEVVFLVDEIEAHLHPRWQRLLLPALLSVMGELQSAAKVQLLVTTHAPLVLASVEPHFDTAQDALFTFDLEGQKVRVAKADWRERGDANAWLTSDVFDLKEARSLPAEEAIQRALEAFRQPDPPIEEVRKIHHDLHALLKDTDPFWPRWLLRARAAGVEP